MKFNDYSKVLDHIDKARKILRENKNTYESARITDKLTDAFHDVQLLEQKENK